MKFLKLAKFVCLAFLFFLSCSFIIFSPGALALESLNNARDVLNTKSLGAYAQHSIRFSVPVTSPAIRAADYIIIDLPNFRNITEPTMIKGDYEGTPVFTVLQNRVRITGINIQQGSSVIIYGITAYNPVRFDLYDVFIRISEDIDGTLLRNQVQILASATNGSVTVEATIPAKVGTLRISGKAAPGMFITFSEGGDVIGTTTADELGNFFQVFPGAAPIVHNIQIFGTDSLNRVTPPTFIEVFTRAYEITSVSDLILAPTISIDKTQINHGDEITATGMGVPGYKAIIFSEYPLSSRETIVNLDGSYSYVFNSIETAQFQIGDGKIYSLQQDGLGTQSLMSAPVFMRILSEDDPGGGEEPACNISQGDLNCDDKVDLIDFSILLYHWGSSNAVADINDDGSVNLIDFSIMMFYWNG